VRESLLLDVRRTTASERTSRGNIAYLERKWRRSHLGSAKGGRYIKTEPLLDGRAYPNRERRYRKKKARLSKKEPEVGSPSTTTYAERLKIRDDFSTESRKEKRQLENERWGKGEYSTLLGLYKEEESANLFPRERTTPQPITKKLGRFVSSTTTQGKKVTRRNQTRNKRRPVVKSTSGSNKRRGGDNVLVGGRKTGVVQN